MGIMWIVIVAVLIVVILFLLFFFAWKRRAIWFPLLPTTTRDQSTPPTLNLILNPTQISPTSIPSIPPFFAFKNQPSFSNPSQFSSASNTTKTITKTESTTVGSSYQWSSTCTSSLPKSTIAFTYDQLVFATNGFEKFNLIGKGGFGEVYKGIIEGKQVAVKKLASESQQGEKEFRAETDIISRVHHKNLVSLIGYCLSDEKRMLVYEFVPNKTLQFHLHGTDRPNLNWKQRFQVALGSARGLAYLHDDCYPKIIHRDIKAANILLDLDFEPKVADFGLARFQSGEATHVNTRIMGTIGYIAPEFACTGRLTDKADVFSVGVVFLELITGKPPIQTIDSSYEALVTWARPLFMRALKDANYDEIVDPSLNGNYDPIQMARLVKCAVCSVRQTAHRRPTMGQIVQYLRGHVIFEELDTFGTQTTEQVLTQK